MATRRDVKAGMVALASTTAVETIEADIESRGIILTRVGQIKLDVRYGGALLGRPTIESKHCVQSSRYTAWLGPGGRSSR
jgi:hypothetical protein